MSSKQLPGGVFRNGGEILPYRRLRSRCASPQRELSGKAAHTCQAPQVRGNDTLPPARNAPAAWPPAVPARITKLEWIPRHSMPEAWMDIMGWDQAEQIRERRKELLRDVEREHLVRLGAAEPPQRAGAQSVGSSAGRLGHPTGAALRWTGGNGRGLRRLLMPWRAAAKAA
jgi:hypothetical protein